MNENADKALLPAGMSDLLPPEAAVEAAILESLMAAFQAQGYDRIKPPLIEFEESLLAGLGAAMVDQTFRLMDPVSQRMMGVRADMTPQVARIAMSRLGEAPRPLRLSYAGQILRVKGSQLRPERQFTQVGAELIGAAEAAADAEVIAMAAAALGDLGTAGLSVDLGIPTLVAAVCDEHAVDPGTQRRLRQALDRKDAAGVEVLAGDLGEPAAGLLSRLSAAAGPMRQTLDVLAGLELGAKAAAERDALTAVTDLLEEQLPDLSVTVDPVENRGFEYHSGVTFTFFAKGVRGELGTGGRYVAENGRPGGEPATGFTLFMDTVLRALSAAPPPRRLFLPPATSRELAASLREEGWITVRGLSEMADDAAEARRMGCGWVLAGGKPDKLDSDDKD